MVGAEDIICSNDWRSLFLLLSGPELCGNHYVGEIRMKERSLNPNPPGLIC